MPHGFSWSLKGFDNLEIWEAEVEDVASFV